MDRKVFHHVFVSESRKEWSVMMVLHSSPGCFLCLHALCKGMLKSPRGSFAIGDLKLNI